MRIHYDHQVFSLQNTGGNSRYHFELLRHLAAHPDLDIDLFLGVYPFENLAACHPERSESVRHGGRIRAVEGPLFSESIDVILYPTTIPPGPHRYLLNEVLNTAHVLHRGRYDIYHPTHHRFLRMVRARRMVVTHHDCTQEKFPAEFRFNRRVLRWRKTLYNRADAIICISEASRQDLLAFYAVDPAKTRVIHHGVTRLQGGPQLPSVGNCGDAYVRPYLLYVGSRALYKNFRALLHAFRDSGLQRDFDLLVFGTPFTPDETAVIAFLGLAASVIRSDASSDAALADAYSRATLFVYPSLSEGFGFPPLEAMTLGCSVAASNLPAIQEVCGDAPFFFDPTDHASMAAALKRGVSDTGARAHAIARGHQVASQYTWEKCAAETLALYRSCQ